MDSRQIGKIVDASGNHLELVSGVTTNEIDPGISSGVNAIKLFSSSKTSWQIRPISFKLCSTPRVGSKAC
jgi:hypothetical protein